MEKWCLIFFTFTTFFPQFLEQLQASSEYTRPALRPVIVTDHTGSESDPQQVHISLVGKDHMKVSWVTSDHHAPSTVEYGQTPGKYEASAKGVHITYTFFFYTSGKIHHVVIGPLEPRTTYYYRCGSSGPEFSFRTPTSSLPIEFVVVGDLGQTEWTASTLAHIGAMDYDVLLLPGDLSYAIRNNPYGTLSDV
ncbi:hypothetical protein Vadar_023559 [Vaccinium darrowii]|uniref:Uncharacterized protein n=1 Tax=Vaccinium darrowii TaxID=229202 RepID=A0ACB7YR82_9ERIC|nr:hypothetical protein Vadar_023559 [Vaccinium darrowii]